MKRTLCTVLTALTLATALPAIGATTEAGSTSAATTGTTTGATVGTTAGTTGGLAAGAIGTTAVVTTAAGNNNMSPEYLTRAIRQYLPQYEIPFSAYHRMNVFTSDGTPFR